MATTEPAMSRSHAVRMRTTKRQLDDPVFARQGQELTVKGGFGDQLVEERGRRRPLHRCGTKHQRSLRATLPRCSEACVIAAFPAARSIPRCRSMCAGLTTHCENRVIPTDLQEESRILIAMTRKTTRSLVPAVKNSLEAANVRGSVFHAVLAPHRGMFTRDDTYGARCSSPAGGQFRSPFHAIAGGRRSNSNPSLPANQRTATCPSTLHLTLAAMTPLRRARPPT